jgi:tetratricopeptide (TPR) repeat protein
LQGLEFIYEKSLFPELEYIFRHALVQEVAYNSLLINRRKEIHEKIGLAIESLYPKRLEEFYEMLAYHYSRSGNLTKAYQYLKASAEKAVRSDALLESIRFYTEAKDTLSRMGQTDEIKKEWIEIVLSMRAPVSRLGYSMDDYPTIVREAEALAKELGDDKNRLRLWSTLGSYYIFTGNSDLGWSYMESSLAAPEVIQDVELMVPIGLALCGSCSVSGDMKRIIHVAPVIVGLIESSGKQSEFFGMPYHPYSYTHLLWGYSTGFCGNFCEGERLLEKALSLALEIGHKATIGTAEWFTGAVLLTKGEGQRAKEHLENAIKHLGTSHTPLVLGPSLAALGYAHTLLGQHKVAVDLTEKGVKMNTDIGSPYLQSTCHLYCSLAYYEENDLDQARDQVDLALRFAMENNQSHIPSISKIILGALLFKTGQNQMEAAEQQILEGISLAEQLGLRPFSAQGYLSLGEAYALSGQKEKGIENLKKAESMFEEMGMDYWLGKAQEALKRLGE